MSARNGKARRPTIRCAIYTRKSSEEGLDLEFNSLDAQREAAEAYSPSHVRHRRLVIDSVSDLERNTRDPLVFNDFTVTLLNKAVDWGITTLMTYEAFPMEAAHATAKRSLSFLADNVVVLRHVDVNNAARKCVTIQKARGRSHDASPRELVFRHLEEERDTFRVEVRKGFEGMADILGGQPKPASVELRLFHENEPERQYNETFVKELKDRLGERVRYVPFGLAEIGRTFWDREEGRDVRPDADVTVVSLDEPWVRIFATMGEEARSPLARWHLQAADSTERLLVSQLDTRLRDIARFERADRRHRRSADMLAAPHYVDLGLLLRRTDLAQWAAAHTDLEMVDDDSVVPTHWNMLRPRTYSLSGDAIKQLDARSFEHAVIKLHRKLDVPGFAFNMDDVEAVASVFLELCWNFFADPDFLVRARPPADGAPETEVDQNLERATDAMEFLCRLRWAGVLPYPCTLEHCAQAAYARVWYANLANMQTYLGKDASSPWKPIPFLTSAYQYSPGFGEEQRAMVRWVEDAETALKTPQPQRIASQRGRDDGPADPSYVRAYEDHIRAKHLNVQLARIARRRHELRDWKEGGAPIHGWACSGAWYLGVLSGGANANLGWSVIKEALDPRRVERRAFSGAGLPASYEFYQRHSSRRVPGLADTTFGYLHSHLLGRLRSREEALHIARCGGYGSDRQQRPPRISLLSQMPEAIYGLVMAVLDDPRFRTTDKNPFISKKNRRKLRQEIATLFGHARAVFGLKEALPPRPVPIEVGTESEAGAGTVSAGS
jgi:hypothetical protein